MLFTESFITDAGKILLARAAAQAGKMVWTRAATSSLNSDSYDTQQMNALTEETFGTKTSSGVITNAFVNDGQSTAAIYCELTNEQYSGEARTFGAWAKIQGDQDDVLVVVARCGSGVTPTTVNPASAGIVKAFVDFELDISAEQAQSVQVSEGWYATQAALQDEIEAREALAARVVTTHKPEDTTTGDNQSILGEKTFVDNANFGSNISVSNDASANSFTCGLLKATKQTQNSSVKGGEIGITHNSTKATYLHMYSPDSSYASMDMVTTRDGNGIGAQIWMGGSTESETATKIELRVRKPNSVDMTGMSIEYKQYSNGYNVYFDCDVHAPKIHSVLPYPNDGSIIPSGDPIGCIILAVVSSQYQGLSGNPGEVLANNTSASGSYLWYATASGATFNTAAGSSHTLTPGKYVALMHFDNSSSDCLVLVQRIE